MIQAHPTTYGGLTYRSKLESKYAILFDLLGWTVQYEPEQFHPGPEIWYTPDFFIEDLGVYVEIKPTFPSPLAIRKCRGLARSTGKIIHLFYGNVLTAKILTWVYFRHESWTGKAAGGYHTDTVQWCTCRGQVALRMCPCSPSVSDFDLSPVTAGQALLRRALYEADERLVAHAGWRYRPLDEVMAEEAAQQQRVMAAMDNDLRIMTEAQWVAYHQPVRRRREP